MIAASGTHRRLAQLTSLAGAILATLATVAPAHAQLTESLKPSRETARSVVFDLERVATAKVVDARLRLDASPQLLRRWLDRQAGSRRAARHVARRRLAPSLPARKVRAAADRSEALRINKPRFAKGGRLHVKLQPAPSAQGPCAFDPATMTVAGCRPTIDDTAAIADPTSIWGKIDCQNASRHQLIQSGGDTHLSALGDAQANDAFRRLSVFDGDDVWGERCELGLNDHRFGPTAIFEEGQRWITTASVRLPDEYPLLTNMWQVVMQIKQTQPSANGGGEPVIALHASGGRWQVEQSNSAGPSSDAHEVWSIPAQTGAWTRFAFDVTYSQDASRGSLQVYVDLNADGDALDANEQSPRIHNYTLKYETAGGTESDGIAPGESIPSHLRFGPYHHSAIPCLGGCAVDLDNVQVIRAE